MWSKSDYKGSEKMDKNKVLQNNISVEKVQEIARKVGELVALYHLLPVQQPIKIKR